MPVLLFAMFFAKLLMRLGLFESIKPEKCNILPAENYFTPSGNEILILLKLASFEEKEYMSINTLSLVVCTLGVI